jgi:probable rRNA maturation factor
MTAKIMIVVEDPKWKSSGDGLARRLRKAARLALGDAEPTVTILLAGDAALRALNAQFRGKDQATNVLAFPASEPDYLGDVAIAYGVAAREAKAAKKPLIDHVTHLVVHGTLHLLGYDHIRPRQAERMESLETKLLATLGIANPYAKAKR